MQQFLFWNTIWEMGHRSQRLPDSADLWGFCHTRPPSPDPDLAQVAEFRVLFSMNHYLSSPSDTSGAEESLFLVIHHSLILSSILRDHFVPPRPRLLNAKSLKHPPFLLLPPFPGKAHCTIQGASCTQPGWTYTVHNLNNCMHMHSHMCCKILTTWQYSLNGKKKMP